MTQEKIPDAFGYSDDFLGKTPKAQSMKEIIDEQNLIKIKNFCCAKDNVKRIRAQTTDWEKYLQKTHLIKNCYPKYTKNSENSTVRKQTSLLGNGPKALIDLLTKEDLQMANST